MRIATLLHDKGAAVTTIRPEATIVEALSTLTSLGIGALVVSTDGHDILGIISERDVVRELDRRGAALLDLRVADVMTTEVFVCGPAATVDELMAIMTDRRVRHVPVVEDGGLAGIVSIGDVVKSQISELQRERAALYEYITTGR